jgi:membrane fusion protein, heavy metal efflux system
MSKYQHILSAFIIVFSTGILIGCSEPATTDSHDATPEATATAHSHETPGEDCFICNPAKRDSKRLWCKEHGRYEDRCFLCHPEIEDTTRLYCKEHFLYEDECFLCHPEILNNDEPDAAEPEARLIDGLTTVAELSDLPSALYCNEHDVLEEDCGICHPELLSTKEVGEGLKVRFASPESATKAGVETGLPGQENVIFGDAVLGELTFNANRLAVVTPFADGVIREVFVDVGESVKQGQLLAEVNSPTVADAKSDFVKALAEVERARLAFHREERLLKEEISSRMDYERAQAEFAVGESEVARAKQQLFNLGLTDVELASIEKTRSTSSILSLRAPFDGSIIERNAVFGTAVNAGSLVFRIADLETMWLEMSVPESEAMLLENGAKVRATFAAFPNENFDGELVWIASHIDESSRTVNARALMPNAGNRLKSGLFGNAVITKSVLSTCLTVPSDAVQTIDGQTIVFAKLENDLYEAKVVDVGPASGDQVSITRGLYSDDVIALSESYILKSELLKGKLGAGCVHD